MSSSNKAEFFGLLGDLQLAIDQIAETWQPDDPNYRADICRQTLASLSYSYFAYFHATPEHPDWAPLWNPVFTLQPNPDDIYIYSPIRGDLTYRVSGNRGTVHILSFTTQKGMSGMVDAPCGPDYHNDIDDGDLTIGADGNFSVIFSAQRPSGYTGDWAPIHPEADGMTLRYRSYDWANERDPQLSIECLDPVAPKPRLTPQQIETRIREMAKFPARKTKNYFAMQNGIRDRVGINVFEPVRYAGVLPKQIYLPAVFEFANDEALILETELPEKRRYWNFQLNDPYFNAIEYVYRLSSTNGAMAKVSSDGKFRAVLSLQDPGVPNWLDTAGYTQGTIYGRWFECSSTPTPTLKRVKLDELRNYLPDDTPVIEPEERAEELRKRIRACQRRRRW